MFFTLIAKESVTLISSRASALRLEVQHLPVLSRASRQRHWTRERVQGASAPGGKATPGNESNPRRIEGVTQSPVILIAAPQCLITEA